MKLPITLSRFLMSAVALVAATSGAYAQNSTSGIPGKLMSEVVAPAQLPPGSYSEVAHWSSAQFGHQVGESKADPDAQAGVAWTARASLTAPTGAMLFGPYARVDPSEFVAFFRIKLEGEIGDENIATIDACVGKASTVLAQRDIYPTELIRGRYIEAPIAFTCPGGELECRVMWKSTTTLTVDGVTLFRRVGPLIGQAEPMAEMPMATGKPSGLKYLPPHPPFEGIFPRSNRPARVLTVCDVRGKAADVQFLVVSMQGLVNRTTPRIYCLVNAEDPFWLDWLKKSGKADRTESAADGFALVEKFRTAVKGMVITDPTLPATRNVATMVAGVMDGVVVSPRLASGLKLPVLADLRGRWKRNVDAYRWAYSTLWDKMNHYTAACLWPTDTGLRDYVIQHRIPVFWLPGRIDSARPYANAAEEMKLMESLLARMPANIPMMGYPYAGENIGMGEGPGVGLLAEFGKYLVGSPGLSNVSLHAGYPNPARHQHTEPSPAMKSDKVYYSFLISDGDNLPVIQVGNWPQLWRDPVRGTLPLAWTISPASAILLPDIIDYYYSTASKSDTLIAAVSGVGYTYPQQYGKRYTTPSAVYDGFLDQSARYMKAMDLTAINPSGVGPVEIARYAERIPTLKAIFPDYGKQVMSYPETTTVTAGNVPVFHAVTMWEPKGNREQQIEAVVAQVKAITPADKPAFLHVFICNWFFDLPALKEIQKRLGFNYEAVSPGSLAQLCRQDMEHRAVYLRMPTVVGGIEGRQMHITVPVRNVSSHAITFNVKASANGGNVVASPTVLKLEPAREIQISIDGYPSGSELKLRIEGEFGVHDFKSALVQTLRSEIVGPELPGTAKFDSSLEAVSMPKIIGTEVDEPGAATGKARIATKGDTQPGHIVYGPYRSYAAGKYIALFRVKRTGEGSGVACLLDATVGGAAQSLAKRTVDTAELPIGEWKAVPVAFTHPGGSLETRAIWPGNASLMIDRIDLYRLAN